VDPSIARVNLITNWAKEVNHVVINPITS